MYKNTIHLFFLKFLKIPLSILTLSLTAKFFGVSLDKDIWLLGSMLVSMIGFAVWGPINETFRAKFISVRELHGEDIAISYTQSLFIYMILISLVLIFLTSLFSEFLSYLIAPSFNEYSTERLSLMIRMLLPILLLSQINALLSSILNAYDIYYIPELASLVSQVFNLFLIYFFAKIIGINILVFAYYISALILSYFLLRKIIKLKINLFKKPIEFNFNGFKIFLFFSIPFFIPYFFGQLSNVVEKSVATSLGLGVLSILDFSKRIPELLNSVLISVILTILVPTLTKLFVKKNNIEYDKEFISSYKLGLLFLTLFIAFFINAAEPVSNFLYHSSSINILQMQEIIKLSKYFSVCLIAVFSYIIFGMSLLSSGNAKLYALCGSMAQIFVILFNYIMVKSLGIEVFPISYFLAHFLAAFYMFLKYPFDKKIIYKETFRYYALCILSSYSAYFFYSFYKLKIHMDFKAGLLFQSFYCLFIAIFCVLVWALVLRIKEIYLFLNYIRSFFNRF